MLAGVVGFAAKYAKRLLAYHSISQMGYIIFDWVSVSVLERICYTRRRRCIPCNKSRFVQGCPVPWSRYNIYQNTGDEPLQAWRPLAPFPATAVLMLVAVLGITGAPGLNGYASKTLLHHAAGWLLKPVPMAGVGGAAVRADRRRYGGILAKLYYLIFIRKPGSDAKGSLSAENPAVTGNLSAARKSPGTPGADRALLWMQAAIGLLAAAMVIIGTSPEYFAEKVVIPAVYASGAGRSAAGLAVPVSLNHGGFSFWAAGDMISMVITLLAGVLVCFAGLKPASSTGSLLCG